MYAIRSYYGFFHGDLIPGTELCDISWLRADAAAIEEGDWRDPNGRFLSFLLCGEAGSYHLTALGEPQLDDTFLVVMSTHQENLAYPLPPLPAEASYNFV